MLDGRPDPESLTELESRLITCRRCERLVEWRERVGREKRRAFQNEAYWAAPVPGFGDPTARILLLGLAPGAHGSNRTGRMFTGDASGDFLFPALHRAGLASQTHSRSRDDGLTLQGVFISAAARCAPPGNKPLPQELANCAPWLAAELAFLPKVRVVVALGRIAHDAWLRLARQPVSSVAFSHGGEAQVGSLVLLDSYHVSRQNTNTGRLTTTMFDAVLERAKRLAGL